MLKLIKVDTIQQATGSELLSVEDLFGIDIMWFNPIPLTTYRLELYSGWENPNNFNISNSELLQIDQTVTSIPHTEMPIFKNCFIKELAIKWYHPKLYNDIALNYRKSSWYQSKYHDNCSPRLRFEKTVKLYVKAAELYRELVLELLPLFKEEDRETVKCRMLAYTVGECAKNMWREVRAGVDEDIVTKKKEFGITGIPQETIDIWIEYCNIADAWIAESLTYRKRNQLYLHHHDLALVKRGEREDVLYTHPDKDPHSRLWYIYPASTDLKKFLQERQLALNPPLSKYETINVKMHPVSRMFAYGTRWASVFINTYGINGADENNERVKLLDQLDGYMPKYSAPQATSANTIDDGIKLQEKQIMRSLEQLNQSNVEELTQITNEAIKLLSLVHMRYKISIETKNDAAYFSFFRSATAVDKDNYYEIFTFYLENIFAKCLAPLLRLTTAQPDAYKVEFKNAEEAVNCLTDFSHEINSLDSSAARRAAKILTEIKNVSGHENLLAAVDSSDSGLRQRNNRRVVPA